MRGVGGGGEKREFEWLEGPLFGRGVVWLRNGGEHEARSSFRLLKIGGGWNGKRFFLETKKDDPNHPGANLEWAEH